MVDMEQTLIDTSTISLIGKPYNVILFNDDHHDMMEVVTQIVKATGCNSIQATAVMMEAHNKGRAIAYSGGLERCEHIESILNEIHLGTKIEQV
jgi:ATP-dependent Clp protease adapter protein ClpS